MRGGLRAAPEDRKALILSDSQAAIAAVRKAARTGKARTGELKEVIEEVRRRQATLAVRFACVKAHVGTQGNEKADQLAKEGAELEGEDEGMEKAIAEGGLRQDSGKGEGRRRGDRNGKGGEMEPQTARPESTTVSLQTLAAWQKGGESR